MDATKVGAVRSLRRVACAKNNDIEDGKRAQKKSKGYQNCTHLNSGLERQVRIARIAHLEYAAKPVLGQVANLENLQIRRHRAQVEFGDEDVIDDDGRLRGLVERLGQQVSSSTVEVGVGRERRPVEVEGHVEMAMIASPP
jgi:hypothetical protein